MTVHDATLERASSAIVRDPGNAARRIRPAAPPGLAPAGRPRLGRDALAAARRMPLALVATACCAGAIAAPRAPEARRDAIVYACPDPALAAVLGAPVRPAGNPTPLQQALEQVLPKRMWLIFDQDVDRHRGVSWRPARPATLRDTLDAFAAQADAIALVSMDGVRVRARPVEADPRSRAELLRRSIDCGGAELVEAGHPEPVAEPGPHDERKPTAPRPATHFELPPLAAPAQPVPAAAPATAPALRLDAGQSVREAWLALGAGGAVKTYWDAPDLRARDALVVAAGSLEDLARRLVVAAREGGVSLKVLAYEYPPGTVSALRIVPAN